MSLKHVFGLVLVLGLGAAFAENTEGAQETVAAASNGTMWYAIAAAFGMAIASFGGASAQSRAVAAALEGIARNPGAQNKVFIPMILGVAFIETVVLFSYLIASGILKKM
ncbi:ATP synthase F0 subunit C [bacterium]|nr:ATP synthase F0 subunit C [bacterium]